MDDFLGTSIQYSELQIKLLEKEHYENQQKVVEELINSGFLDSDYEEETESTDNEIEYKPDINASLEIQENNLNLTESESPFIESLDDSKMNISPKSLEESSGFELSSRSSSSSSLVLESDISVVEESNGSNSESIHDDSINNQIIHHSQYNVYNDNNIDNDNEYKYEYENEYDSEHQIQEMQQFDIVTSKSIIRFMEFVFSDIKYLMILFVLMVCMPRIIDRAHQNDNDMQQFNIYGGVKYQSGGCHGRHHRSSNIYHETSIYWTMEPYSTTTHSIINDEDDERDEYQNDDDDDDKKQTKKQCQNKQHLLSFDIMTTTLHGARLSHHEFKINPSDLSAATTTTSPSSPCHGNMRMGIRRNIFIPREMPSLFMNIGAGVKASPQMMRIFKETASATVGRQSFGRSHGLYALVMAFVGIAGFAASSDIDEIITISA